VQKGIAQHPHQDTAAVPARGDETAERRIAGGELVEVHGLGIVFGGKRHDLLAGDDARAAVDDLAWTEIFPMEAGHGDPYGDPRG
jgi:hypothetical protein